MHLINWPQDKLLFIGPEVSQFLKLVGPKEAQATLESLSVESKSLVVFAVNSQRDPAKAGGTHWSLLVYSRPDDAFYHLDSAGAANEREARVLAAAVGEDRQRNFYDLDAKVSRQQANSYDCGIFLLANAEHVTRHFITNGDFNSCTLTAVDVNTVGGFRKYLHQLVHRLKSRQ